MTAPPPLDLLAIAEKLASGYESLTKQIAEQHRVERQLRQRLNQVIKYERSTPSHPSSGSAFSGLPDEIEPLQPFRTKATVNEEVASAQEALQKLRACTMPMATKVGKCPIAHKVPDQEDFERDFTVPGKPSDLGCPFARAGSKPSLSVADPIAAEFHGDKSSTRSPDAGSQCPIRFLDQHSPEEIAQYFENHKHEMPRSHQICVKRYQQNEQEIRQLDAKYGNIVSMIQGLGNKHKQYLPEENKMLGTSERASNGVVEKWAENVSHQSSPDQNGEARVSRFEQPLRDIRVGESPSRPWGIPVPAGKSPAPSAAPSINGRPSSPHTKDQTRLPVRESPPRSTQPQIIFNGPVFFGYSPEQAAVFLQHLNVGGST